MMKTARWAVGLMVLGSLGGTPALAGGRGQSASASAFRTVLWAATIGLIGRLPLLLPPILPVYVARRRSSSSRRRDTGAPVYQQAPVAQPTSLPRAHRRRR